MQREEYLVNEGMVKTTGCKIVQPWTFDFCQMKSDACMFEDLRNLDLVVKFCLFINTFNKKFWLLLSLLLQLPSLRPESDASCIENNSF